MSSRTEQFVPARVPKLTEEQARLAVSIVPEDSPYYRCWLCRVIGHTMYTCPFLTRDQQRYMAYQNYRYQRESQPHMRNLLRQLPYDRQRNAKRGGNVRFNGSEDRARRGDRYGRSSCEYRRANSQYPRRGDDRRGGDRRPYSGTARDTLLYLRDAEGRLDRPYETVPHAPVTVLQRPTSSSDRVVEPFVLAPPGFETEHGNPARTVVVTEEPRKGSCSRTDSTSAELGNE